MVKKPTNSAIRYVEWPVDNVLAYTTTRHHPDNLILKTNTPYDAFNLGEHVGDDIDIVKANRKTLHLLHENKLDIQWLEQVHGNHVVVVKEYSEVPFVADAAITSDKNIALAVMTADCLPILLTNKQGTEIAAIHGGWRPLSKAIIEKTITQMDSPANDIYAWLGPCIGANAFEVGQDVVSSFPHQQKSAFKLQNKLNYRLNSCFIFFTRSNTNNPFDVSDKDFAITYFARLSSFYNSFNTTININRCNNNF